MLGGVAGAAVLYVIASGAPGFSAAAAFAANGFGEHSPGGYSLVAAFVLGHGEADPARHEATRKHRP